MSKPTRYVLWATDAIAARLSTTTVCVSRSLQDVAIRSKIAPASKTLVMGHGSALGIDQSRFRPGTPADRLAARSNLGLSIDAVAVGYVGRLTNDKGITELATAFNSILDEFPNCVLIVAGPRDSTDALPAWVTTWLDTHPNVKYVGPTNAPETLYHAIDVLVLPTKREGLGLVALEASASGVPVITTTATGARDAVVPFVTGLAVAPGDPIALETALAFLIRNADLRSELGRMGPSTIAGRFSEPARIDDWMDLLRVHGKVR
nr:glycosyltransferase [Georgenia sp. H159]